MSDQEVPFNDPEQQHQHPPPDQHGVNYDPREQGAYYPQNPQPRDVDPREQPHWQAPPQQQQGYMGPGPYPYTSPYTGSGPQQMAPGQYRPQMQRRRRRGPIGCLITLLVIVILLIVLVGGALGFLFSGFGSNTATEAHTYSVTGTPTLVINDDIGTINVHSGSGSSNIIVQATKHTNGIWGKPSDAQVSYQQSGSTITINATVHSGISFFSGERVDLDITAPSSDVLQLQTQTGTIDVTGISGRMSLMTSTGTITANQDMLAPSSTLTTNTGSVTFNGSIDTSGGTYQFQTNTGSVDVTLPSDSSFHLNASSSTGSINSDFPVNVQHSGASSTANGDVGSSPQATVTLHTDTGSISLHKG
jgi:hypothetical protein